MASGTNPGPRLLSLADHEYYALAYNVVNLKCLRQEAHALMQEGVHACLNPDAPLTSARDYARLVVANHERQCEVMHAILTFADMSKSC